MTLNDIVQSAQGGQAVANLAARFGLTTEQAEGAVHAMIPALAAALQHIKDDPASLGTLIAEIAGGAHGASYSESADASGASPTSAAMQAFGSPEGIEKIVAHVAEASGVAPETISAMLPSVASILLGGLAHSMTSQGLSGVLGDLATASSAPGGLGSALDSGSDSGGGLLGKLGSIFGGTHAPADPQTAALVAGLTSLSAMFVAGIEASQAHQASLGAMAQSFGPPTPGI
jgi:hypothetical protein